MNIEIEIAEQLSAPSQINHVSDPLRLLDPWDWQLESILRGSAAEARGAGLGDHLKRLPLAASSKFGEPWICAFFMHSWRLLLECDHQLPQALDGRCPQPKWSADTDVGRLSNIIAQLGDEIALESKCAAPKSDRANLDIELNGALEITALTKARAGKKKQTPLIFAVIREIEVRRLRARRDSTHPYSTRVASSLIRGFDGCTSRPEGLLERLCDEPDYLETVGSLATFSETIRRAGELIKELSDPPIPDAAKHIVDRLILGVAILFTSKEDALPICLLSTGFQGAALQHLREMRIDHENGKRGPVARMKSFKYKNEAAFRRLLDDSGGEAVLAREKLLKSTSNSPSAAKFKAYFGDDVVRKGNLYAHFDQFVARLG
ncbi:MAG: hypothetical protein K9K68_07905 [Methylococcaceae bacterium]|nr:hypothetical protein [Methylococcaceae bacterium]